MRSKQKKKKSNFPIKDLDKIENDKLKEMPTKDKNEKDKK